MQRALIAFSLPPSSTFSVCNMQQYACQCCDAGKNKENENAEKQLLINVHNGFHHAVILGLINCLFFAAAV
jgi:hypothetical protein